MKLLLFTSPSCKPCQLVKDLLPDCEIDVPVQLIDVEEQPQVAMTYAVRSVPTLIVVGSDGDMRAQHIGALGKAGIEDLVRRAQS